MNRRELLKLGVAMPLVGDLTNEAAQQVVINKQFVPDMPKSITTTAYFTGGSCNLITVGAYSVSEAKRWSLDGRPVEGWPVDAHE